MEMGIRTAFVRKTYEMVDDPRTDMIVCWGEAGNTFVVKNVAEFSTYLLPSFFKHSNFSSFVRQLNTYGFRKVDPDCWEFANEGFLRGQKHLLKIISRKKPSHVHNNTHHAQPQMQDKPMKSCVEVGNFGIEEEVERLKRDKNVLMQELVRLRQQQQTTDHQLQTVGQRVQVMEQRQQQMMAFLAKAMQSPGFMTQLVQQHSDSNNRRINGVNKKRKLPNQDEEFSDNSTSIQDLVSPNQMVKYQPLMNEAAKTMMGHIMKMNGSPRLEPSMSGSDFLFNNDMQSFAGSSSSQTGLSETLSISSHPYLSTEPEIPIPYPSFPLCESSPRVIVTTQQDAFVSGISPVHGLLSESSSQIPGFDFHLSETGNTDSVGLVNERTPVIGDGFSCDNRIDNVVLDNIPELPGMSISSHPYLSTEPEIPIPYPSFPLCESSPRVIVTTRQDAFVSGVSPVHGLLSESSSQIPGFDFHLSEAGNTDSVGLVNERTPVIGDDFSCDNRIDNVVLDDIPELPGINDVFWEQFLSVGQVAGERDEIDSASLESCVSTELDWHKGQESGWENIQDITHLTERMGLLAQRTQVFNSMFNNCPCSLGFCRCAEKR